MNDKVYYLPPGKNSQSPLASDGGPPNPPGMEARIAVLEETAKNTREALADIRTDMREFRKELTGGLSGVRDRQERDFRILFGALIVAALSLAGLMAKGFHWI